MKRDVFSRSFRTCVLFLSAVCLAGGIPDADAQTYDPNTIVYIDALFCRAHAADCPALILKEQKQTMTLEEADQLGYRIGESGQSGRVEDDCCLLGYDAVRKYPKATIANNALGVAEVMSGGILKYHVHGCHRFTPDRDDYRMTKAQVLATPGGYVCEHCIERGPGFAQMTQEEWDKLPSHAPWVPPAGWAPDPFPTNSYPQQNEIRILLSEVLHGDVAIQESVYINPVATVEHFMIMRFFFPVERWLELYQAYRSTGDTNVLEQLRGSARNYNTLSKNYLPAAQLKAKDPEGMAYMYTMAASARITLQLARKYPSQVTAGELAEAEEFLTTIISVLQPTCEGSSNLDPTMGIPKPLADDFRTRAFNRALNGIGTIGMATAALQDLQVLKSTTAYQSTIDRYRKVIQEYIKNWKNTGFAETYQGKDYFSYPYAATDSGYWVGNVKLFGADDQGHFSHSMQGCYVLYDSVPELGVDDAFMTALANTIRFNSYTTSGSLQTPSQEAIRPYSRQDFALPSERFYLLQAFNAGVIGGQCSKLSALGADSLNSQYLYRLATFNAQYLKAHSQDQTLIHMGEESVAPPAPPTGLAGIGSDGQVSLDWDDNTEGDMVSGTYTVYRSTTSGSGYLLIASNLTSSAYIDNAVVNDTMYYYVVTATDTNSDVSAYSSEAPAAPYIPNETPPAAPTNLTATASDSIVSLNWADNSESDLNSYNIYRSTTSSNYSTALATGVIPSEYADTNVVNGTTYYYALEAVDHSGNRSAKSAEISATPAAYGPTITFGSNHDGYGGFGASGAAGTEVWSLAADSVNYAFGVLNTDETHTASLLKSYTLDRSDGSAYTFEGVVDLTAGYGDDNNRIGILLFNTTPTQTDDGGGGLWLRLNTDGNIITIESGVNGTALASANATGGISGDSWIGQTLRFTADLVFTNVAGTNKIDVTYTLTDGNNHTDTLMAQVDAAGYTGNYCGFATKWRQRGAAPTENTPPVIDYRSFACIDNTPVANDPPEFYTATITKPSATEGEAYYDQSIADNAFDPDGDPMTFSKVSGPDWLEVHVTGDLSGTPGSTNVGQNTFTVQVADSGGSSTATLNIEVLLASGPPTLSNTAVSGITATAANINGSVDNTGGDNPMVTLYWGDNDGGTTPGSWDNAESLGTKAAGSLSYSASSLTPGTTYYYRYYGENTYGNDWADSTANFTTASADPVIANASASAVGVTTATLNGNLTNEGVGPTVVTVYYGTNDGGTTAGNWDSSVSLGNKTAGAVSYDATGLADNTTYYYRFYAQNSYGSSWASSVQSFTTASGDPVVANQAASSVGPTAASLNGEVSSIGGETPTVTLYYGTSDPGQTPSGWDASVSFGSQGAGSLSTNITGLTVGETYYYRLYAQNSYGTDWADPAESFTTPVPGVSIADVTGAEGTDTTNVFLFAVTLAYAPGATATVNYTTSNGTAAAGSDYIAKSGTLTFEPDGPLTQYLPVSVIGDSFSESSENFTVMLSSPVQMSITDGSATGTITDDDGGGGSGTFVSPITTGNNDCDEVTSGGAMSLTDTTLDMSATMDTGLRWENVTIPAGSTITSASLNFYSSANSRNACSLTISCEDADSAAAFSTTASNLSNRTKTTAQVAWNNIPNWGPNTLQTSPDLTAIVQEVVSRGGWGGGNAMVFIVHGTPANARIAYSYEGALGDTNRMVTLTVNYTAPAGGPEASLTLSAPNGGQTWTELGTNTVTWSTSGIVGNVDILLSTDGGATYSYVLASNTANDGTESVTVPAGSAGSNCKILVIETGGAVADESDAVFTIQSRLTGYDLWTTGWGTDIGAATNDLDADGISNFGEYALGGDPTNALVQGTLPTFTRSGNVFLYVHPQRADDTSLVYTVQTRTNLVYGAWTNAEYTITGTNVTGGTLNFVTNEVSAVDAGKFIRLRIQK